jgi:hypothetical protein
LFCYRLFLNCSILTIESDLAVCLANRLQYRLKDMPGSNARRFEAECVDCWGCGKSIQAAQFASHACTCFNRVGSRSHLSHFCFVNLPFSHSSYCICLFSRKSLRR